MKEEHKKQIEQIIKSMKCSKDFQCYKSEFKNLCKAELDAGGKLVSCEDSKKGCSNQVEKKCEFALPFGFSKYYCTCPLRQYLANKLKI